MKPCPVCGSAACLAQSPNHCRTTNRYRPEPKPAKAKPAREDKDLDDVPPIDF